MEKHIEFTDNLIDNDDNTKESNKRQQKLYTRDTPHHLKNKSIIITNNDSFTFDVIDFSPLISSKKKENFCLILARHFI